jgi:hypothetical protein
MSLYDGDPLSPQKGRQPKGGAPLAPIYHESFHITFLPGEVPTRWPSDPRRVGSLIFLIVCEIISGQDICYPYVR